MRFFNPATLSRQQTSRWDMAMMEYAQVMERNAIRRHASMTPVQRRHYLATVSAYLSDPRLSELEKFKQAELGRKNFAGHPKSALFARLLNGDKPFAQEPPLFYSNPWYELLEQEGPFQVNITKVAAQPQGWHFPFVVDGPSIILNQCPWVIDFMNDAAWHLLKLQERVQLQKEPAKTAFFWKADQAANLQAPQYDWSDRLCREVHETIAAGPELIVSYGENKSFYLQPGRTTSLRSRRAAQIILKGVGRNEIQACKSCVFDIDSLFINAQIGNVMVRHLPVKTEGEAVSVVENALDDHDLIEVHHTSWFLHKHAT